MTVPIVPCGGSKAVPVRPHFAVRLQDHPHVELWREPSKRWREADIRLGLQREKLMLDFRTDIQRFDEATNIVERRRPATCKLLERLVGLGIALTPQNSLDRLG